MIYLKMNMVTGEFPMRTKRFVYNVTYLMTGTISHRLASGSVISDFISPHFHVFLTLHAVEHIHTVV